MKSPGLTRVHKVPTLSRRQMQCVKLFADGEPHKRIASLLKLSACSVDRHLSAACAKLGLKRGARLIKWAFANGLSPL